jgi:K+-dependent Na+/Ca+ exchanger-like protein
MLILYILALLACFFLLARIVDRFFISSLDKISHELTLSHEAAGATLMAAGSSAPELFVALFSVLKPGGHHMIGVGSIVGSALFNILVIVGVAALFRTAKLTWQPVIRDLFFYLVAVGLLVWFLFDRQFTLPEAVVLLVVYVVYILAVVYWRKIFAYKDEVFVKTEKDPNSGKGFVFCFDRFLAWFFPPENRYYAVFFLSIGIIAGISWILVELAVLISVCLNIPEAIIALTVIAIGTSVPDLISSVIVARQGRGDMAVSNAIGSNIFDVLIGLGLPFIVSILLHRVSVDVSANNLLTSSVILFSSVVLLFGMLIISKWRMGKISGLLLLALYLFYIIREMVLL